MSVRYVGIDIGNSGAVAVWDGDVNSPPVIIPFPIDEDGEVDAKVLAEVLLSDSETHAVFESVFRPNSVVRKQGAVAAVCQLAAVDQYRSVPVVQWKKALLGENSSDKSVSIERAKAIWPDINLRKSARSRTDWHDAAEAALLSYYCWMLNGNAQNLQD